MIKTLKELQDLGPAAPIYEIPHKYAEGTDSPA
jgi:hypothetical protein